MQITPPYGFSEVVPLTKTHRVRLPQGRMVPPVFRSMTLLPVSCSEFPLASHDYPLVFISGDQGKTFTPMAVLGLEARQNLFMQADETWDAAVYLPAYVRRYPFCMTRITVNGEVRPERVTCVEKQALDERGAALFDRQGNPAPEWQALEKLLFEYEADMAHTEEMCRLLAQHQLLEPFVMQAMPNQGQPLQMTGLFRITEIKLAALDAGILKDLAQKNILACLYAHLFSLGNFERLLGRRATLAPPAATEQTVAKNKLN
jgi:hypothetical protein